MKVWRPLLLTGSLFIWCFVARAAEISPRGQRLVTALETKLQQQFKLFLGEKTRIAAFVHIVESKTRAKAKEKAGKSMDLGYLPVPVDMYDSSQPKGNPEDDVVLVEKVEVDLYADSDLTATTINSAKQLVSSTLKGMNPAIIVKRLQAPPPEAKVNEKDEKKDLKKEENKIEPPKEKDWLEQLQPYQMLIGIAAAGLFIGFGLFILGAFFFLSMRRLGNAFKGAAVGKNLGGEKVAIDVEAKNIERVGPGPSRTEVRPALRPGNAISARDYSQNIKLIQQILLDSPRVLISIFDPLGGDAAGLRWLLPKLGQEVQETLRKFLPSQLLAQVDKAVMPEHQEEEWSAWLQSFAERLVVKKLRAGAPLDTILGSERVSKLMKIPPETLIDLAHKLPPEHAPSAWRLLLELLSREEVTKALGSIGEVEWTALSHAHQVGLQNLVSLADWMLNAVAQDPNLTGDQDQSEFFSTRLLDPVLQLLETKNLGEDDTYIDSLILHMPQLAPLILERFWTPRTLERVPSANLETAFRAANNQQKTALIVSMPSKISQQLEKMLPEGNVRTMVVDQVRRAKNASLTEKANLRRTARLFLQDLRTQVVQGKFDLLPDKSSPAPSNANAKVDPDKENPKSKVKKRLAA